MDGGWIDGGMNGEGGKEAGGAICLVTSCSPLNLTKRSPSVVPPSTVVLGGFLPHAHLTGHITPTVSPVVVPCFGVSHTSAG